MSPSPFFLLLRRRWWLLLLGLVPTVLVTAISVSGQPPIYSSTSTFVVRPLEGQTDDVMRGMDTLVRGVEINTTYASVVGSRLIQERALARLDLAEDELPEPTASGSLITGTNIIEMNVEAGDPDVAHRFAEAVAMETATYVSELENGFGLVTLDAPTVPLAPSGPRTLLMIAVSGVLGTILGLGLVFSSGQLVPLGSERRSNILDPATGAYTEAFFLQRLREEVTRIDRVGGALTVALLAPTGTSAAASFTGFGELLRRWRGGPDLTAIADALRRELREPDVLAHLGEGRFAVLALDRIAPELPARLRTVHPMLTFRVAETSYVGRDDNSEHTLDDVPSLLQRLEEELAQTTAPEVDERDGASSVGSVQR